VTWELPGDLSDEEAALADVLDAMVRDRLASAGFAAEADGVLPSEVADLLSDQGLLSAGSDGESADATVIATLVVERIARASAAAACLPAAAYDCAAAARDVPVDSVRTLVDASTPLLARRDEGGWNISGEASRVEFAATADGFVVLADEEESGPVVLLVDPATPGVQVAPVENTTGMRGAGVATVRFEQCTVPDSARVAGREGALAARRHRSLSSAAIAVGIAAACVDAAVSYAAERRQFGRRLNEFVALRGRLASMQARTLSASALLWQAARAPGALSDPASTLVDSAALEAVAAVREVSCQAVQVHGGYGYLSEQPVERMMRDAISVGARMHGTESLRAALAQARIGPRG
jgi:alkylation response protein AidB-like acyl-CoA dehydrogenase